MRRGARRQRWQRLVSASASLPRWSVARIGCRRAACSSKSCPAPARRFACRAGVKHGAALAGHVIGGQFVKPLRRATSIPLSVFTAVLMAVCSGCLDFARPIDLGIVPSVP